MAKTIQLSRNGDGEVLSQAVGPRPGSWKAMSAPMRRVYEQNSHQRLGRRFSTRVERDPTTSDNGSLACEAFFVMPTNLGQAFARGDGRRRGRPKQVSYEYSTEWWA